MGPGVIEAFYAGYETINPGDNQYLCKLDLDLRLAPRYFEILMDRMTENPRIATCSGKAYVREGVQLINERHADETSLGMTKFYCISCFEAIGGFVREVMWDGIDCHRCRMKGWIACSWDEPQLRFVHPRPMGRLRYEDPEFRRFLRRYQRRALVVGKKRAIEEIHGDTGLPDGSPRRRSAQSLTNSVED